MWNGGGICVTEGVLRKAESSGMRSVYCKRWVGYRADDGLFIAKKKLPRIKLRGVPEREPSQRLLRRTHPWESCP